MKIRSPPFRIRTKKCLIVLIITSNIATSAIKIYDLSQVSFSNESPEIINTIWLDGISRTSN